MLDSREDNFDSMRLEYNSSLIKNKFRNNLSEHTESELESFSEGVLKLYDPDLDINAVKEFSKRSHLIEYLNEVSKSFFDKKAEFVDYKGDNLWNALTNRVMIMALDSLWRDHLSMLDSLRHGINLRAVVQKDPLNEYKREAFIMFESMLYRWQESVMQKMIRVVVDE